MQMFHYENLAGGKYLYFSFALSRTQNFLIIFFSNWKFILNIFFKKFPFSLKSAALLLSWFCIKIYDVKILVYLDYLGKKPTVITISRSSEDDYCPPNQV